MPKFAEGGVISGPGASASDSVLVQLDCGYYLSAREVRLLGNNLLKRINATEAEEP